MRALLNSWASDITDGPKFTVIDVDQFISLAIPPREHVLTPWLPEQGLCMIYAPRGIGKTYVALNIAYAVASGTAFLHWKAPKPRGVLYLDGEMPAALMQERIKGIVTTNQHPIKAPFRLLTPDMQEGTLPDLSLTSNQFSLKTPGLSLI